MEVKIDSIQADPTRLRFGGVVHYGDGGPIRFVIIECPVRLFTQSVRADILALFNQLASVHEADEPLF